MKTRNNTIVPRNPYVMAAAQRAAGAHVKSHKVKRQRDRQQLRKVLRSTEKGGDYPPFLLGNVDASKQVYLHELEAENRHFKKMYTEKDLKAEALR